MPITKSEVEQLISLGLTRRQVAEKLDCAPSYVQKMIDQHGIQAPRRTIVPIEEVRELVEQGCTLNEIHAVVGFSKAAIHKAMQKIGGYRKLLKPIPPQIRHRMYRMAQRGVYYKHISAIFGYSWKQVTDCLYRYYGGKVFAVKAIRKGCPPSEQKIAVWAELTRKRLVKRYHLPEQAANAVALAAVTIQEYPDGKGVASLFWRIANARMVDEIRKEKGDSRRKHKQNIKTELLIEEPGVEQTPETYPDELEQLREKISELPDRLKKFGYTYLKTGGDKAKIGTLLGLSESSVFRIMAEMLAALRESYGLVESSNDA